MIEPNVALITAPIPILLCVLILATAIPIKYESGSTLASDMMKISASFDSVAQSPDVMPCDRQYGRKK